MRGLYYKTIFRNERTGLTEFYFSPTEPCEYAIDGLVHCIGKIGYYSYKIPIELEGKFNNGEFYVDKDHIPTEEIEDRKRLVKYINNQLTEGQVNKIVHLGNPFELCSKKESLESLCSIGLERNKAKRFLKKLKALSDSESMTKYLMQYEIPMDRIGAMIAKGITLNDIKQNPYIICTSFEVSIFIADAIAKRLGYIHPYAIIRLNGFVYNTIMLSLKNGNACIKGEQLLYLVNVRMKKSIYPNTHISMSILNLCLMELKEKVVLDVIEGEVYVYSKKAWLEELKVVQHIERLQRTKVPMVENINIEEIEKSLGIKYVDGQRAAFELLKTSGVKLLIGPPGTGKTAIIKGLLYACQKGRKRIVRLSATTGRAAQVMSAACAHQAETVNKMLDIRPYDGKIASKNMNNDLEADLVIVDEASMLGLELASYLFQSIRSGSILLLVGDADQLQSVDYGNVLADLIECGCIETYRLSEIMRQHGAICENAVTINQGSSLMMLDSSFHLYEFEDCASAKTAMLKNYKKSSQVLTPVKNHELGTSTLNQLLQDGSGEPCLVYGNTSYYINNRVIMLQTNYEKGYFNGDMGVIREKTSDGLIVAFHDKNICLDRSDYYFMALAFSITIHKSQGDEFPDVHVMLPDQPSNMLTRRIIYTAITRAKKRVFIYSVKHAFEHAVDNKAEQKRVSKLEFRIKNVFKKFENDMR